MGIGALSLTVCRLSFFMCVDERMFHHSRNTLQRARRFRDATHTTATAAATTSPFVIVKHKRLTHCSFGGECTQSITWRPWFIVPVTLGSIYSVLQRLLVIALFNIFSPFRVPHDHLVQFLLLNVGVDVPFFLKWRQILMIWIPGPWAKLCFKTEREWAPSWIHRPGLSPWRHPPTLPSQQVYLL